MYCFLHWMKYDTNELKGIRRFLLMQCMTAINALLQSMHYCNQCITAIDALLLCVNLKKISCVHLCSLIHVMAGYRSKGGSLH